MASVLFWEAPAGVGFSYCDDGDGCPGTHWNDTTSAADNAHVSQRWWASQPSSLLPPLSSLVPPRAHYLLALITSTAQFLCAFFEAYPELQTRDFFMTGESYAGVYIPTTVSLCNWDLVV